MRREELDAMPDALRILADQISSPDDVPSACLRDAAAMIGLLRMSVADAVRRPMGVVPDSASWLTSEELDEAEKRRPREVVRQHATGDICPSCNGTGHSRSGPRPDDYGNRWTACKTCGGKGSVRK